MNQHFDFAIIGAAKAGTTSLTQYVSQHPDIFYPREKEIPFFLREECWNQGNAYLDTFYGGKDERQLTGTGHVHMLPSVDAASRLHQYSPDVKLVAVLRNPIERAYSAYWHSRRLEWETSATFEEALDREPARSAEGSLIATDYAYVNDGCYYKHLQAYLELFPRERLYVVLTDDLKADTPDTLAKLLTWLGVEPRLEELDLSKKSNVASQPRYALLNKFLLSRGSLKQTYKSIVPEKLRYEIAMRVKKPLVQMNLQKFDYPPIETETRARLREYFAPHNAQLGEFLDRDLSHWT
ncbi:MAG: sulfotransferase domain-containing protein [Cyanobacteria bacterium J06642_2]